MDGRRGRMILFDVCFALSVLLFYPLSRPRALPWTVLFALSGQSTTQTDDGATIVIAAIHLSAGIARNRNRSRG